MPAASTEATSACGWYRHQNTPCDTPDGLTPRLTWTAATGRHEWRPDSKEVAKARGSRAMQSQTWRKMDR
eukprot:364754-Chlamydomonas_euryale.AAC.4